MKILTAEQIRAADKYTIENEPVSSVDLMERAANACTDWIMERFPKEAHFVVICGMGNNGGDGLAMARQLVTKGYRTEVIIVPFFSKASDDFLTNKKRLEEIKGVNITELKDANDISPAENCIIIDTILGSGLSKPAEGQLADVIQKINSLHLPVISIDMPSGLAMGDNTDFDKKKYYQSKFHTNL